MSQSPAILKLLLLSCVVCLLLAGISDRAAAVPVSFEATDNATVQAAGPRTGANGKNFFNLEGSANAAFASFGVADFNFASLTPLGGTVTAVSDVTLKMTQSNAAFSHDGPVSVFQTDQTAVDIQSGTSPLTFTEGMDGAGAIDADLAPTTLLGTGMYVNAGTTMNPVDSYTLTLPVAVSASLIAAINGGTTFRLITTPDASDTAATYAGFGNNTFPGPTLEFEATLAGGTFADGDFDEDGDVDNDDLVNKWSVGFGTATGATHLTGDADKDGDVDGDDYLIWQQDYVPPEAVAAASPAPEPSGLILALAAGGAVAARRRRMPCRFQR